MEDSYWIALVVSLIVAIHNHALVKSTTVGVNCGMLGNDLPAPTDVVNLYKKYNIAKMRLFNPNPAALQALQGSGFAVTVGIPTLAASQGAVDAWFTANIQPYIAGIQLKYIAVGNEVIPGPLSHYVLPVMNFLRAVLDGRSLNAVKVTTVVPVNALGSSHPPSSGAFAAEIVEVMTNIVQFLTSTSSPLMVNVYPYFACKSDPGHVRLDYAIFTSRDHVVVHDGLLGYTNLFDAIVDAFYTAMEKVGGLNVPIVVSESGWPSDGSGEFTTEELAGTYNVNFINHLNSGGGTPKRPTLIIEGYIFAMFNENQNLQARSNILVFFILPWNQFILYSHLEFF